MTELAHQEKTSWREVAVVILYVFAFLIWIGSGNTTYAFATRFMSPQTVNLAFGLLFTVTAALAMYIFKPACTSLDDSYPYFVFAGMCMLISGIYFLYLFFT